jgi:hypothetical protein
MTSVAVCGIQCEACPHFGKPCAGCYAVKGKTFWAVEHVPAKICPLFQCSVNEKKHRHCGECAQLPCKTFRDMKDPSWSDEEHQKLLKERVERLKQVGPRK